MTVLGSEKDGLWGKLGLAEDRIVELDNEVAILKEVFRNSE